MQKIEISMVKKWREAIGATHIVVFAVDENNGGEQCVATHGETEKNAREAATAGNNLKSHLGWPTKSCKDEPLERICKNCTYFEVDRGIHCFNGWTGDGSRGCCLVYPGEQRPQTLATRKCSLFEPKH
jgi:hypothetical protein